MRHLIIVALEDSGVATLAGASVYREDTNRLIEGGESETVEFKSSLIWDYKRETPSPTELGLAVVREIASFLNTMGGTIIVGIDDAGRTLGLMKDFDTFDDAHPKKDQWRRRLTNNIRDILGPLRINQTKVDFEEREGKPIARIDVDRSDEPVFAKVKDRKEFYIRAGNTAQLLDAEQALDYSKSHWRGDIVRASPGLDFEAGVLNQDNLADSLHIPSSNLQSVLLSDSLQSKANEAARFLTSGGSIIVLGEAGVGKSTFVYSVCESLTILGRRLRTGGVVGIQPDEIYVCDDVAAKGREFVAQVAALNCAKLVSSRTHYLDSRQRRFGRTIVVERSDFTDFGLAEILRKLLTNEGVSYDEDGVKVAIEKSRGLPAYLSFLATWLKTRGSKLDTTTARSSPPDIYRLVADMIQDPVLSDNEPSLGALFALSETKRGRLHDVHLRRLVQILDSALQQSGIENRAMRVESSYAEFLQSSYPLFYLAHDVWKEVLRENWQLMGLSVKEPYALRHLRELNVSDYLCQALRESLQDLESLKPDSAAWAATVALENLPALGEEILSKALESGRPDFKAMLAEQVALNCPEAVRKAFHRNADGIRRSYHALVDGAPNFCVLYLIESVTSLRQLARKDGSLKPELGVELRQLGSAYRSSRETALALSALQEALRLQLELSATDARHEVDAARSLSEIGAVYKALEDDDNAVRYLREARSVYAKLAARDAKHRPALAHVQMVLGQALTNPSHVEEAVTTLTEILPLSRKLAGENPVYETQLARVLSSLGRAFGLKGDFDAAIMSTKEALQITRRLAAKDERRKVGLASTLDGVGGALSRKGDDEAVVYLREAATLWREIALKDPRHETELMHALVNLGLTLRKETELDEALRHLEEALEINRRLAARDAQRKPGMVVLLRRIGSRLRIKGLPERAQAHYNEALSIEKELSVDPFFNGDLERHLFSSHTENEVIARFGSGALPRLEFDGHFLRIENSLGWGKWIRKETFLDHLRVTVEGPFGVEQFRSRYGDEAFSLLRLERDGFKIDEASGVIQAIPLDVREAIKRLAQSYYIAGREVREKDFSVEVKHIPVKRNKEELYVIVKSPERLMGHFIGEKGSRATELEELIWRQLGTRAHVSIAENDEMVDPP